MLVTLSGIVTLVRLAQPAKAEAPILVTGLPSMMPGITSSPAAEFQQLVMVTSPSVVVQLKTPTVTVLVTGVATFPAASSALYVIV